MQNEPVEDAFHKKKLVAIGTCAASIAHELKNSLSIIIQGLEFLSTCVGSDPVLTDVLERIKKSALRADSTVKGLLNFAKQVPMKKEKADVRDLIEESLSCVELSLQSHNIKVKKEYAANLPTVWVDHVQMKQVLVNLLSNAVDAMPEGGMLTLRTETLEEKPGHRSIQIVVSDTGSGIPGDILKKVFEPFFTTKGSGENVGLGLSITKGIIDRHDGTIHLESQPGKGTSVFIRIPVLQTIEQ